MIYEYVCEKCNRQWDVYKPVSRMQEDESCEACGSAGRRLITGGSGFMGEKVEHASFDPAFGCVVKGSSHRRSLAKERGMIEIGNESPDSIAKTLDAQREAKRLASYEECLR